MSNFLWLWTVVYQTALFMEFSRQEYQSVLPYPPPLDLPNLGIKSVSPMSTALAGWFFTMEPPGKPDGTYLNIIKATYDKPTANIILSGKKLKSIRVSTLFPFFKNNFGSPSNSNHRRNKKKVFHILKEEIKLSIIANDLVKYKKIS